MGSSSGSKGKPTASRKSIMSSKGKSSYYYYAVLGICIACLPVFVAAATRHRNQRLVGARREPIRGVYKSGKFLDLQASASNNAGIGKRTGPLQAAQSAPVPTAAVPPPAGIAPPASPPLAAAASDASFAAYRPPPHFPKSDLTGAPSYAPRYAVPPVDPYRDPWGEQFPFEVASFRRRAQDEDDQAPQDDDYKPSESKRKKHAPSMFKRMSSMIRNTGSAIFGAPSYIFKRYRGSWRRFGSSGNTGGSSSSGNSGGKKKKGGGWKSWSTSDKNDGGYGGWEELEPTGGYDHEGSQYPSDKGWNNGKGYRGSYDSNERRSDKDANQYRDREYRERDRDYRDDYKDYDNYRSPPPSSSSSPSTRPRDSRDRQKYNSNSYREETHYDDYDGRRTTAFYGPARKSPPPSSKRPYVNGAGSSGNGGKSGTPARYDDEY